MRAIRGNLPLWALRLCARLGLSPHWVLTGEPPRRLRALRRDDP